MRKKLCLFIGVTCLSTLSFAQRSEYGNVLNIQTQVNSTAAADVERSCFSDLGAWHAYALPSGKEDYGSFIGPLLMDMQGEWLANTLFKLHVFENDQEISLANAETVLNYYPGMLRQELEIRDLKIEMTLLFVSNRESAIQTTITNTSDQKRSLELSWSGQMLSTTSHLKPNGTGFNVSFAGNDHLFSLSMPYAWQYEVTVSGTSYQTRKNPISLEPGGKYKETHIHDYYPRASEQPEMNETVKFDEQIEKNEKRWNGYLENYFSSSPALSMDEKRLAVKSIMTLVSNWRSKSKDLLHDGVFPSISYQGFYGVWSWDSWKQAVALGYFFPELAKENILCMFDYQDAQGMVADCIYTERKDNNWRNTKPPLAAWAVQAVYAQSKDLGFVKKIYPALVKYHTWWYKNRDHDKNGLCEYGSVDGTRIAAAWESGMDNAVRFDSAVMVRNNDRAWSLNQESVDLNTYLYAEKIFLAQLAAALNQPEEAKRWSKEAASLRALINKQFFNSKKGYYCDKLSGKTEFIEAAGPEGWIPLWAGLAETKQAEAVRSVMEKPAKFSTFVPLPTLAADHPDFNPAKGYWRGPVWLDQFYFGIAGLRKYKYTALADELTARLLQNAKGLTGNQPIRETYHPLTGEGLNAINFSWSAAHILMLLKK